VWWYIPVIPALGRLRQEDQEFWVNLGHIVKTLAQNKIQSKQINNNNENLKKKG
jgi:hypothetical protein